MPVSLIKPSSSKGELAPAVWGRLDFAGWHSGASVIRNCYVSYRGGVASRAGLKFVGQCLQAASPSSIPPRIIRFQFNIFQSYILEFGDHYMRVAANGAYVTDPPMPVTAATSADPASVTITGAGATYAVGDWIFLSGLGGATQFNGRTFVIASLIGDVATLDDTFGNPIDSLAYGAYTGGGTAQRIFTTFDSPYAAVDLPYLKVIQSANVMSLCCVNQQTGVEYPPIDLRRLAANDWDFQVLDFKSSILPPASASATASSAGSTNYSFVVTAVDGETGEESNASPAANVTSVDIASTAGSIRIHWSAVPGASQYNIYMAPPSVGSTVPIGSFYGYIGSSFGTEFVNSNIVPDDTTTPPLHLNPFARGTITSVNVTGAGSGATQGGTSATIVSGTGSGASIVPVIVGGELVAFVVQNGGENYLPSDTVSITTDGTGLAATAVVGPQSGTYPGVVSYFQQRRVYANTLNNPDTYFFSQTGNYTNFDQATPPIDSDAIVGTPWGQQVDGIQWLQPMPGGLIASTGEDTWQLSGTAGAGSLITPSQQSAAQQESNGYAPTVKPLKINYDLLYVGSFGSYSYDLKYNFWNNIYAGTDISVLSGHLFDDFQIVQWAWAKQPNKIVWATRSDGRFLSLTFLPEQELVAWSRHDTNGLVVGNEVTTELPVNAPYFVVKRYIVGKEAWAYYLERMDNRSWNGPEDPWCVDAGLALVQPAPNAVLTASAANGPGTISGVYIAEGGQRYSSPSVRIVDPARTGSGADITLQLTGGVVTGFTVNNAGENYSPGTTAQIVDPTGAGATLVPLISQNVIFNASQPVFDATQPGDVIRIGGGQAIVSSVNTPLQVVAAISAPILNTMPNDPNRLPIPAVAGDWTITTPVSTIGNLDHLEGMQVAVLADGAVVAGGDQPLLTVVNGQIDLPTPASAVVVGLPFIAQYQTMHADIQGGKMIQGKRQAVPMASLRVEKTRGIEIGANQPVASTLDFQQEIPWTDMQQVPDWPATWNVPSNILPLFTGDKSGITIGGGDYNWNGYESAPSMICAQQRNPLPMSILAMMPVVDVREE